MGVEKNISMSLKLSDVFCSDENKVKDYNKGKNNNLDIIENVEDYKEKSKQILNKYKISEFNKKIKSDQSIHEEKNKSIDDEYINNNRDNHVNNITIKEQHQDENIYTEKNYKNIISSKESNLLIANGATGMIVHNGIMCLSMKGIQPFIITSVKNSFCVYDPHKLRKAFISEYFVEDIKNLYSTNNFVYVIFKRQVYKINDNGNKKVFSNHHKYNIINILITSDYLLTYSAKEIIIWNDNSDRNDFIESDTNSELSDNKEKNDEKHVKKDDNTKGNLNSINKNNYTDDNNRNDGSNKNDHSNSKHNVKKNDKKNNIQKNMKKKSDYFYKSINLFDNSSYVEIKSVIHPEGYINKVIIITNENKIYLYNINKEKIIHEYKAINILCLNKEKYIKIISRTLKNEELCIITSSNELYILDIEKDQIVYTKNIHMNDDFASCVNFYTYEFDDEMNYIILIGTEKGKLLMFNLKNNQYFIRRYVHDCVKTILVSGQGYIYTCGYDNKIHLLNINKNNFTLDIIKTRNSCIGIVNNIKYLDDENHKLIVSANMENTKEGNLFIISPHNPEQNNDFSLNKKLNILNTTIIDFDININRHYDWNNILICFENSDRIYLASSYKKTISNEFLILPNSYSYKRQNKEKLNNEPFLKNEENIEDNNDDLENEEYKIYNEYETYQMLHIKKQKYATSVLISSCGHIGIVGYNDGEIHSFNIQSTTYRNEYKLNKYSISSKAHINGNILKLYLYGINYFVSASSSKEDTCLRVWNIYTSDLLYVYNIKNEYTNSVEDIHIVSFYHFNILTAVCLSNNHTLILDIEQKCITRKFHFAFPVTNIIFSKDNKLIFFALQNNTLLIYDIISNTFVDYLLFKNSVTSMVYDDIYLYTAHKNCYNFVYSFTNKNLFNKYNYYVSDYKSFNAIPIELFSDTEDEKSYNIMNIKDLINMNEQSEDNLNNHINEKLSKHDETINEKKEHENIMETYTSSENQINKNLITLSGFNISKIAYLIFLDKIKDKCKVEENVKRNEEIPFFLTTKLDKNIEYKDDKEEQFLQNVTNNLENKRTEQQSQQHDEQEENQESNVESKEIVKSKHIGKNSKMQVSSSKLQEILSKNEESYIKVLKYFKSLSPSGIHYNILCLSTKEELENMMNFFIYHVKTNDNVDLIQAYLFIFLKAHGKKIMKSKEKKLKNTTKVLLQEIQGCWSNINFLFENIIFFIKFLTNIQLE
ncbi:U3 snoRNA-associated small subunit rRNA processing protein, putative [Plasmodium sp. DRC-Itaito]|nr:U3 snoRNA-associated small subunit rRNA processing protein, putative [Plasmodium sp. DRC-Itaito]